MGFGYSGGIIIMIGKIGDIPACNQTPNSRIDLFNKDGRLIQQRWFDEEGKAMKNRDWEHGSKGGVHNFPHIHKWNWNNKTPRGKAEDCND